MRISDWSSDVCSSDLHAERQRSTIKPDKATPSSEIHGNLPADEGQHTTHYSIVDAKGNEVRVTYTITYLFGVAKMAGDTRVFLKNEMEDFRSKPGVPNGYGLEQGKVKKVETGKRPHS